MANCSACGGCGEVLAFDADGDRYNAWETCKACRCPTCTWPLATLEHGGCTTEKCQQDDSRR